MQLFKLKLVVIFILLVQSCSMLEGILKSKDDANKIEFQNLPKVSKTEYIQQLTYLKFFYTNDSDVKIINISKEERNYLEEIALKIINNNELFFQKLTKVNIYIVKDQRPFFFSNPNGDIFLSLKLFKKYLKNEHLFAAVLSYELVRIEKNIYRKNLIAPTGVLNTDKYLNLIRVGHENRNKIHKWAYYILNRSGFDASLYLSWLQLQNRNAADFKTMYGDSNILSKEEAIFKGFLIRSNKEAFKESDIKNSSKRYYQIVNKLGKYSDEA